MTFHTAKVPIHAHRCISIISSTWLSGIIGTAARRWLSSPVLTLQFSDEHRRARFHSEGKILWSYRSVYHMMVVIFDSRRTIFNLTWFRRSKPLCVCSKQRPFWLPPQLSWSLSSSWRHFEVSLLSVEPYYRLPFSDVNADHCFAGTIAEVRVE